MSKSFHQISFLILVSFSASKALASGQTSTEIGFIQPVLVLKSSMQLSISPSHLTNDLPTASPSPAEPTASAVLKSSIQMGVSQARLTDNNPSWNDAFVKGNTNLGSAIGVLNWEVSKQSHFNETGQAFSLSLTHELNEDWYATMGVGRGINANFLPQKRIDVGLYRKLLAERRWITGLQYTGSKSGDGNYRDQALQVSTSYYFPFPLVAEIGFKHTVSNPGNVGTSRYYGAATYGEDKKYFLSARYDAGNEGYLPQGNFNSAVNFKSTVASVTWRQWQSPTWGYELQAERYRNPSYKRDSVTTSIFYDY